MNIFISWSGNQSLLAARSIRDWLPLVLHYVNPWMSDKDITAGSRWATDVGKQLESSNFGIVCITPENLNSAWVLFESGALAKTVEYSRLVPLLFDLDFKDVSGPLSQFQAKKFGPEAMESILDSINKVAPTPINASRVQHLFSALWPQLEKDLQKLPAPAKSSDTQSKLTQSDVLENLVQSVRSLNQRLSSFEQELPARIAELIPATQSRSEVSPEWLSELVQCLNHKNKIGAIKALRTLIPGMGLAVAKDFIEQGWQ